VDHGLKLLTFILYVSHISDLLYVETNLAQNYNPCLDFPHIPGMSGSCTIILNVWCHHGLPCLSRAHTYLTYGPRGVCADPGCWSPSFGKGPTDGLGNDTGQLEEGQSFSHVSSINFNFHMSSCKGLAWIKRYEQTLCLTYLKSKVIRLVTVATYGCSLCARYSDRHFSYIILSPLSITLQGGKHSCTQILVNST
jgi:hypothetical protein